MALTKAQRKILRRFEGKEAVRRLARSGSDRSEARRRVKRAARKQARPDGSDRS